MISNKIDLVVVGPEDPLVNGIVNYFEESYELRKVKIFGPKKSGAQLEGSKSFSKSFMNRHDIPTANSKTFNLNEVEEGIKFLKKISPPYVLKADGLAAGKGVFIVDNFAMAKKSIDEMMTDQKFGDAGETLVIEEFLKGEEASFIAMVDGVKILPLATSQDHKAIEDGDIGLFDFKARWNVAGRVAYTTYKSGIGRNGKPWSRKGVVLLDATGRIAIEGWDNAWPNLYNTLKQGDEIAVLNVSLDAWAIDVKANLENGSTMHVLSRKD